MSQPGVERTLGKLLTDESFRRAFFRDACSAARSWGLDLVAEEIDALQRVPRRELARVCALLDDRIRRLRVREPAESEETAS
jgi:hypothetical protein